MKERARTTMENLINTYLREGEQVRWQGQPQPIPLLDNGSRMLILRKWALTVVIVGALTLSYLSAQDSPGMGFPLLAVACGAVLMLTPLLERSGLMKSRYYITNQRIIHMTKDKVFYYMDLADVDAFEVESQLTEQDSLVLGSAAFADAKKHIRWRAYHPMEDPEAMKNRDHVDGMVFYNIGASAASAAQLLREMGCKRAA